MKQNSEINIEDTFTTQNTHIHKHTHTHTKTPKTNLNVKVLKKILANKIHQYFFKKKSSTSQSNMAYPEIMESEKMH